MLRSILPLLLSLILLCDMEIADDSSLTSVSGKCFTQLFSSGLIIYALIAFQNFILYFHLRFIFNLLPIG